MILDLWKIDDNAAPIEAFNHNVDEILAAHENGDFGLPGDVATADGAGYVEVPVVNNAVALTAAQAKCGNIVITGAATATVMVTMPDTANRTPHIYNRTSGGQALDVYNGIGGHVAIPYSASAFVICSSDNGCILYGLSSQTTTNVQRVYAVVPSGALDGTNKTYTLPQTPLANTLRVIANGVRLSPSDFGVSGTALTLLIDDGPFSVFCDYEYTPP